MVSSCSGVRSQSRSSVTLPPDWIEVYRPRTRPRRTSYKREKEAGLCSEAAHLIANRTHAHALIAHPASRILDDSKTSAALEANVQVRSLRGYQDRCIQMILTVYNLRLLPVSP